MTSRLGTIFGSKNGVPPYQDKPQGERRSEMRMGERQKIRFYSPESHFGHEGVWVNSSDGGAFIETNDTLPLLTVIRIEAPGLVCEARVCRVHWLRPDERSERSSGMAVVLLPSPSQSATPQAVKPATSDSHAKPFALRLRTVLQTG